MNFSFLEILNGRPSNKTRSAITVDNLLAPILNNYNVVGTDMVLFKLELLLVIATNYSNDELYMSCYLIYIFWVSYIISFNQWYIFTLVFRGGCCIRRPHYFISKFNLWIVLNMVYRYPKNSWIIRFGLILVELIHFQLFIAYEVIYINLTFE